MDVLARFDPHPALLAQARAAINQVHRRPVNLRKVAITSSEATLRGATLNAQLDTTVDQDTSITAYSVLAPGVVDQHVRTFVRAPLQVLAHLDVLCQGSGQPQRCAPELSRLARVITRSQSPLLPVVVHGMIYSSGYFGSRSATIARVASRIAAMAVGLDPRGLCVPELYFHRHRGEYEQLAGSFTTGQSFVDDFTEHFLRAYIAGAEEAEGIALAAKG